MLTICLIFIQPRQFSCGHCGRVRRYRKRCVRRYAYYEKLLAEMLMTDVHATSDGVILMFHDPTLDRTTTGTGLIKNQPWKGVIEYVQELRVPYD